MSECYDQTAKIMAQEVAAAADRIAHEWTRPSVVHRPAIFHQDGVWCAILRAPPGTIGRSVRATGASPEDAMRAFDAAWQSREAPL